MWKKIIGFPNYSVSSFGNVRNDSTMHILKPWESTGNYLYVALCDKGKKKTKRVHRIVAEAFCLKHYDDTEVNHIDGDKKNNNAENLEWVTKSENVIHSYNNRLQTHVGKGEVKRVICVEDGMIFSSCGDAGRYYGVNPKTIYACCARKSKGRLRTYRFYGERKEE